MSFSSEIKNELNEIENAKSCCAKAKEQTVEFLNGKRSKHPQSPNKCCKKAVLRTAFICAGLASDPEKSYHLQITLKRNDAAAYITSIMDVFGLNPKTTNKNDNYIAYLKDGGDIADFLNISGAHRALMYFENIRIKKERSNTLNRAANFDTANIESTVRASVRQIKNIEYIDKNIGIENLPDSLRDTARLRVENSSVSLEELGKMLNPPIGKSGVNHRLRKLDSIAESIHTRELQQRH